ncbi:MAG: hypothetical protein B7Z68_08425 [Acidobacteria bacterium 21-70-11]|nr:MAG: hypothetical protein B7Z68_08425 [Acidobacteria bacterium 21-70-11]
MVKHTVAACVFAAGSLPLAAAEPPAAFDAAAAQRFADLALACVHKEYPNKIAHVLASDADVKPPRELTPAFCGCFDWHSAVHGHWLLVRLARTFPEAPFVPKARAALAASLTPAHIAGEVAYMGGAGRADFERPYGWARSRGDSAMATLIERRSRDYYLADRDCPMAYEPSGQDFLSPCLAEADLMPETVTDPTDGKLAHLDGLNLSRAWMLEGIASGLPAADPRVAALRAAAASHRQAGLAAVTGEHYEGGHWLGSFAVYLVTGRGLPAKREEGKR